MPPVEKKAPRGRPQKAYSPKEAGVVQSMSQYGVPHEDIAATIGMCVETMQRLYSHELAQGRAVANAKIGKRLFDIRRHHRPHLLGQGPHGLEGNAESGAFIGRGRAGRTAGL